MPRSCFSHASLLGLLALVGVFLWAGCSGKQPVAEGPGGAPAAGAPEVAPVALEVARVQGPGGLGGGNLPQGAFLGPGARLEPGATYETGPGTLVELSAGDGRTLRLDGASKVHLDAEGRVTLETGRILSDVPPGAPPISLRVGDDVLTVEVGQAQAERDGETNYYAVVHGHAVVVTGGERMDLGAGATLQTPLAEAPSQRPLLSLAPLERTTWAMVFDEARRLAEDAPPGIGSLTARVPGTNEPFQALQVEEQKVFVSISGRVAVTTVEQTFRNDRAQRLEGRYVFPIPAGASISGLELLVGDRWMKGEFVEKVRARRIYREIVDAVRPRDPALLEWQHGSLFKMRVFPIPPGGTRKIRLHYTEVLPISGTTMAYRYPFGGSDSGAEGTRIGRFVFEGRVDTRALPSGEEIVPLLDAPTTAVQGSDVVVRAEARDFAPAHPVGLDVPAPAMPEGVFAQGGVGPDGRAYVLATVRPELPAPAARPPADVVFVFDRSHGTAPSLWTAARGIFEAVSYDLGPEDRVAVLACDTACDVAPGALAPLGADRRERILSFLDAQVLAGASDVGHMIRTAADVVGGTGRRTVVVYLGDGVPTSGELATDELLRRHADVLDRVEFEAVALGSRADLLLLESVARRSGGDVIAASPTDDLDLAVRELAVRLAVPPLRGAEVSLPPMLEDIHPAGPRAVRPGQILTFTARVADGPHGFSPIFTGPVRISGRDASGAPVRFEATLRADLSPTDHPAARQIAHLWAKDEIDAVTAARGYAAKDEIVRLSRTFGVLSRFTALLVLENEAMYRRFGLHKKPKRRKRKSRVPEPQRPPITPAPAPAKKAKRAAAKARPKAAPMGEPAGGAMPGRPAAASEAEPPAAPARADRRGGSGEGLGGLEPTDADDIQLAGTPEAREQELDGADTGAGGADRFASTRGPRPLEDAADPSRVHDPWPGVRRSRRRPGRMGPRGRIEAPETTTRALARMLPGILAERDARPTSRRLHERLVRTAIAAGDPQAVTYARAWIEADPDHPGAIEALADALTLAGDHVAHRVRAGTFDAAPFRRDDHVRMAGVFGRAGDFERACSHLRAAASIDPSREAVWHMLVGCLVREYGGRADRARAVLDEARGRAALVHESPARDRELRAALDELAGMLARGEATWNPFAPGLPEGRLTIVWQGPRPEHLEIALVSTGGRLDGTPWPIRSRVHQALGAPVVAADRFGPSFVDVINSGEAPVHGTVRIDLGRHTRSYPVSLRPGGRMRLAYVQPR
ncbi:MAG: hypothetical protein D6705_05800 [Deltaproteobacteria bacterium]|nr:MAG: hypothetical protein D6705_05800 [Deltaproteobacteria bacterium]